MADGELRQPFSPPAIWGTIAVTDKKRRRMIDSMNRRALQILEYDKIIRMLEGRATSDPGRKLCRELLPSSVLSEIEGAQQETSDAASRLLRKSAPSFGNTKDVRPSLMRLNVGGSLNIRELLDLAGLLENTARIKSYGRRDSDDSNQDSLDPLFSELEPLTPLSSEIRRCILSEDEIADDASPELRKIRRNISAAGQKIHQQLQSYLNGPQRTYLQDAVITMRDGRYCLPVRADYRSSVPGMVHDQSSTGATLFIEPMSVVKLNNDIRELEGREQKEIEQILATLSSRAASFTESIESDMHLMAELDFIFAKGSLALEMNASRPVFNEKGIIRLRKARHPLIDKKKVVPIDLELGRTFDLLIVTGPNTGGKTVSLKTVGLLQLMGQAGLHIPALDRSELSVFTEIYPDIGDEQSIEQSLSTFSSHMTNIVSFLGKADRHSLVLFDELGAGTDPTEGAALAIAILSDLHQKGIRTMATTHYSELKVYALSTSGVENASCEFNVETLSPTYRLLIGVPGKSNAFAISEKLGLPEYIIESARRQISEQDESFEDVLSSLEQNRVDLERQKAEFEKEKSEFERQKNELLSEKKTLEAQKDKILQKANQQAHDVLQEAKDYADKTMKDFRKFGRSGVDSREMERRRNALREKMNKTESRMEIKPQQRVSKKLTAKDLHLGDAVRVLSLNLKGTVSSRPDAKGNVLVQMGIMRSKVSLDDLEMIDEPDIITERGSHTSSGHVKMSKSLSVSPEINLIGKTVDEAVAELDKYLDDAYLAHLSSVRIIHGKGTGALRKGVQNYLRRSKHVASYHLAEYGEGDAGVTIAELKK